MTKMMQKSQQVFNILWIACVCMCTARSGFLLTLPSLLQSGGSEQFCLTLHEVASDLDLQLTLKNEAGDEIYLNQTQTFAAGDDNGCFEVQIPASIREGRVKLHVEGLAQDGYSFEKEETVDIGSSPHLTFIQTDKPIYKPGQTVRVRILTVKPDLRPLVQDISSVWVRDATGVRVMQWKDVPSQQGMISLSLPLSREPSLGPWIIEADINGGIESHIFAVEEYVLPKYEVTVNPPAFVLVNAMNVSAEICAKYTYGESVRGELTVTACIKQPYYSSRSRPCVTSQHTLDGCISITLDTVAMKLSSMRYSLYNSKLHIEAMVTESATGNVLNGTGQSKVTRNLFNLDLESNSPSYYKPGLPYHGLGLITHPDGTPAADETVTLRYSTWAHMGAAQTQTVYHNFTSDFEGRFPFTIPDVNANSSFSIRASMPSYIDFHYSHTMRMPIVPGATLYLKPWYSPSDSFLQIEPFTRPSCGDNMEINVLYTSHMQTTYNFHYQVMSRGNIVASGHQRHQFQRYDVPMGDEEWQPAQDTDYYDDTDIEYLDQHGDTASAGSDAGLSECQKQKSDADSRMMPAVFSPRCQDDGNFHEVQCHGSTGHCWCVNYMGVEITDTRIAFGEPECDTIVNLQTIQTSMLTLHIPIDASMSPLARIIVFYVNEDGETIADSKEFSMPHCTANQVELSIGAGVGRQLPGSSADVVIHADAGSICGLGVVDKSVQLLGGDTTLTLAKVFSRLEEYDLSEDSSPWRPDTYCQDQFTEEDYPRPPWNEVDTVTPIPLSDTTSDAAADVPVGPSMSQTGSSRARRSIMPYYGRAYSDFYDSSKAFKMLSMLSLTDTDLDTRPCRRDTHTYLRQYSMPMRGGPMQRGRAPGASPAVAMPDRAGGPGPQRRSKTKVDVRKYFPETFLWDLHLVGSESSVTVATTLPHSLTTWVGSVTCLNPESGLGLASADITVFQPFFASFNLPYSVVRGERVPVAVSVFNYLTECLVVQLTLKPADWFQLASGVRSVQLCVCGGLSVTHQFHIIPSAIGNNNITVRAESVLDGHACAVYGHQTTNQYDISDAVTRMLLVEAEGVESGYSVGSFVCPDGNVSSETMSLDLPADLVQQSDRGYFTVIGDVMGPALSGLDKLIRLPTGCGEQNMLNFAPNIYVMQYLQGSHQTTDDIEHKALEYMRTGYQRELRYRHDDGSYSAFGNDDDEGSTWLTAFVLKSFSQAEEFINIDEEDLAFSKEWLKNQQMENDTLPDLNGCIRQRGKVLHKAMKGGVSGNNNPATLTAYVLAALLQAGEQKNSTSVQSALFCLSNGNRSDTYSLALTAYAYALYDNTGHMLVEALDELELVAIRESGTRHWSTVNIPTPESLSHHRQASSADVELTSYVLLAKLEAGGNNVISECLPIVRWLTQQRNADGGFASTQDTVLGLQALAKYASLVYSDDVAVEVNVQGGNIDETVLINDENSLVQVKLPLTLPNSLTVTVSGQGCAFVQANVHYNIMTNPNPTTPHFQIDIRTRRGPKNDCKARIIGICTRHVSDESTNMAVIAVKMVSGWIPTKDSLKALHNDATLDLKRFDVDKNWVHFYFDELSSRMTCLDFVVTQEVEVENTKPGIVHVYDYYDKDISHEKEYKIEPFCGKLTGTKEDLPHLTLEEFIAEEAILPGVQRRLPVPRPGDMRNFK